MKCLFNSSQSNNTTFCFFLKLSDEGKEPEKLENFSLLTVSGLNEFFMKPFMVTIYLIVFPLSYIHRKLLDLLTNRFLNSLQVCSSVYIKVKYEIGWHSWLLLLYFTRILMKFCFRCSTLNQPRACRVLIRHSAVKIPFRLFFRNPESHYSMSSQFAKMLERNYSAFWCTCNQFRRPPYKNLSLVEMFWSGINKIFLMPIVHIYIILCLLY